MATHEGDKDAAMGKLMDTIERLEDQVEFLAGEREKSEAKVQALRTSTAEAEQKNEAATL